MPAVTVISVPRLWRVTMGRWHANTRARRRLFDGYMRDPRLARDIGLTDADLLREAHAPFWRTPRRSPDDTEPC